MHWVIDESEVAALTLDATHAQLRLSAARVVAHVGAEGSGQGAWQPVVLTLHSVRVLQGDDPAHLLGRIREGVIKTDDQRLRSLPLPCAWQQPVVLELEMATGEVWCLQAQGLQLEVPPQACAVDALQC